MSGMEMYLIWQYLNRIRHVQIDDWMTLDDDNKRLWCAFAKEIMLNIA